MSEKKPRQHQIKKAVDRELDSIDFEIIRLMAEDPGLTDKEIGVQIGYARTTVNERRSNPRFKAEVRAQQQGAINLIKETQAGAVLELRQISRMDNEKLKFTGSDKVRALRTFIDGLPEKASGVLPNNEDNELELTVEQMQAQIELLQEIINQRTEDNEAEA